MLLLVASSTITGKNILFKWKKATIKKVKYPLPITKTASYRFLQVPIRIRHMSLLLTKTDRWCAKKM